MYRKKVLFVCIHNSARSQMAEAFLRELGGERFEAHSAGIEPGRLNPLVVEAMGECGIDISQNCTTGVDEYLKKGTRFDYVVTVCDSVTQRCPFFPGQGERLSWSFPDPSSFAGTREEKLAQTRQVRDAIRAKIEAWLEEA